MSKALHLERRVAAIAVAACASALAAGVWARNPTDASGAVMETFSAHVVALVALGLVVTEMTSHGIRRRSRHSNRGLPKAHGSIAASFWVNFTRRDGGSGRYSGACPAFGDPANWDCVERAESLQVSDCSMTHRVAVA